MMYQMMSLFLSFYLQDAEKNQLFGQLFYFTSMQRIVPLLAGESFNMGSKQPHPLQNGLYYKNGIIRIDEFSCLMYSV